MSRREFISPEGLRLDGRRPRELRKVRARMGIFADAEGSAYIEQGNTKVLVVINGPRDGESQAEHDRAIIECEFTLATFSTAQRRARYRGDRRSVELGLRVAQTLEAAVLTHLYPRSRIDIFVQVLQSDGGHLAAAINGATLALIDAGVPMKDFVCACSAGVIDGVALMDLNQQECNAQGPELTIAILPKSSTIILAQMESRVHLDSYSEVQDMAIDGCQALNNALKRVVIERTTDLLPSFGPPTGERMAPVF